MKSSTKKWLIPTAIIVVIVIVLYSLFGGTYNSMVTKQEKVNTAWSNVENQYQRRSDLIPNLVNTVKGAADFEKSTLTEVIEARAKATSVNVDLDNLNPSTLKKFQAAQGELSSALSRLMVSVERYPKLTATQNFQTLQSQLEGTENRITIARMRYNEAAKAYNTYIRKFPQNMLSGVYGFDEKPYFEAEEGAEEVPEVQF